MEPNTLLFLKIFVIAPVYFLQRGLNPNEVMKMEIALRVMEMAQK